MIVCNYTDRFGQLKVAQERLCRVCPSVFNDSRTAERIFVKFYVGKFYKKKTVGTSHSWLKSDYNKWTLCMKFCTRFKHDKPALLPHVWSRSVSTAGKYTQIKCLLNYWIDGFDGILWCGLFSAAVEFPSSMLESIWFLKTELKISHSFPKILRAVSVR
jgi:hypothetical protein